MSALDFLRDIGKHFRVNQMIRKESVARRLESQEGISYTEFSYQLLQALDYLELYRVHGCTLQTGGSDQWGNLTAGVDLIRRAEGATASQPSWCRWSRSTVKARATSSVQVPPEYQHLAELLRKVLPELGEMYESVPKHFDDAAWIGARLVEILPISLGDKQICLEMDDPLQRLARLSPLIRRDESA